MPTPMTSNSPALVAMVAQHGADGGGSGGAGAMSAIEYIANNDLLTMGMGQKDLKSCAVGRRAGLARQDEVLRPEHRHESIGCG